MKDQVEEIIHGVCPSKSNCYRIAGKILHKTKALTEYENKFYIQCRNRNKMISGYFEIELKVFYPNEQSDLDNALKCVLDCLQKARVIKNDNKCTKLTAEKYLDKNQPRIELKLIEL